ncbi:MAG TPA: 50S ribosomal protein L9 [Acidimicrobiales bacterium]|nr:50S ribosomal protein L9 [Acidimicrobiales bacterium]
MKLVLRSDVNGVGRRGDIVDVAGGFARNFLLPQGRAIVATEGVEAQASAMRRARDLREARDREAAESKAKVLAGAVLSVRARAGTGGRLFGSVTALDVVEAARGQKGVEIERRHVVLDEPIKAVGSYDIPVRLFEGVATVLTIEVSSTD